MKKKMAGVTFPAILHRITTNKTSAGNGFPEDVNSVHASIDYTSDWNKAGHALVACA